MVQSFGVVEKRVSRIVLFGAYVFEIGFIEERLPVAQKPVTETNHEAWSVRQYRESGIIHTFPIHRWFFVIIGEQYSLANVDVDNREKRDDEQYWQRKAISKCHEYGVEHKCVLKR